MPSIPLSDRFWAKVQKSPDPDGCWLWTGTRNPAGYGQISIGGRNGRPHKAHRVAWELLNGPIPPGMEVCHNCPGGDNPRCVRPDHCFLGTHRDNMQDASHKQMMHPGERTNAAKLTAEQARAIRSRYQPGVISLGTLAREYGVDPKTIHGIVQGRTWRHV